MCSYSYPYSYSYAYPRLLRDVDGPPHAKHAAEAVDDEDSRPAGHVASVSRLVVDVEDDDSDATRHRDEADGRREVLR